MKKLIVSIILLLIPIFNISLAEGDNWTLIPEGSRKAPDIAPGGVSTTFAGSKSAGDAFSSGVFSWDNIFDFFKYLAQTLSQIGLIVGAIMIIYAGYKYATGVFTGDASKGGKDAIKSAIYGVLIVIFSYTIMKLLISTFL